MRQKLKYGGFPCAAETETAGRTKHGNFCGRMSRLCIAGRLREPKETYWEIGAASEGVGGRSGTHIGGDQL